MKLEIDDLHKAIACLLDRCAEKDAIILYLEKELGRTREMYHQQVTSANQEGRQAEFWKNLALGLKNELVTRGKGVVFPAEEWLEKFPPEWDRHPWANWAWLQPSYSSFDGITFMWIYFEDKPKWGKISWNWVSGKHGFQNPVKRAPLSDFFDVQATLQYRPQPDIAELEEQA